MKRLKENFCILPNKDPPISFIIRINISLQHFRILCINKKSRLKEFYKLTPPPLPVYMIKIAPITLKF